MALLLDPELDYVVPFRCGCTVTFLASDRHASSLLACCPKHRAITSASRRARNRIERQAEEELRLRRLVGPDVPPGDMGPALPRRRNPTANVA